MKRIIIIALAITINLCSSSEMQNDLYQTIKSNSEMKEIDFHGKKYEINSMSQDETLELYNYANDLLDTDESEALHIYKLISEQEPMSALQNQVNIKLGEIYLKKCKEKSELISTSDLNCDYIAQILDQTSLFNIYATETEKYNAKLIHMQLLEYTNFSRDMQAVGFAIGFIQRSLESVHDIETLKLFENVVNKLWKISQKNNLFEKLKINPEVTEMVNYINDNIKKIIKEYYHTMIEHPDVDVKSNLYINACCKLSVIYFQNHELEKSINIFKYYVIAKDCFIDEGEEQNLCHINKISAILRDCVRSNGCWSRGFSLEGREFCISQNKKNDPVEIKIERIP